VEWVVVTSVLLAVRIICHSTPEVEFIIIKNVDS
jgi:hypothetical protein